METVQLSCSCYCAQQWQDLMCIAKIAAGKKETDGRKKEVRKQQKSECWKQNKARPVSPPSQTQTQNWLHCGLFFLPLLVLYESGEILRILSLFLQIISTWMCFVSHILGSCILNSGVHFCFWNWVVLLKVILKWGNLYQYAPSLWTFQYCGTQIFMCQVGENELYSWKDWDVSSLPTASHGMVKHQWM